MTYEETMLWGAAQYSDALAALGQAGLKAEFVQTGGMCAALMVTIGDGYYLLVADAEDTLPGTVRTTKAGGSGLYPPEDSREQEGPVRWDQTDDNDLDSLVALATGVLAPPR